MYCPRPGSTALLRNFLAIACCAVLLSACSQVARQATSPHRIAQANQPNTLDKESQAADLKRQVIWRASQTLEVDEVEPAVSVARQATEEAGGYVESSSTGDEDHADLQLRVPVEQFTSLMDVLAQQGRETDRRISSDEVTGRYIDLEARLKSAIALRSRLEALGERAENLKDLLTLEHELSRVQVKIETLEAQLRTLRAQVAYTTIRLILERDRTPGPVTAVANGVAWVLGKLFYLD